ncbi:MAG: hypothetical protein B7Y43_10320 [Sphingomonas sp. 28-62-20]|uniref:M15 family metallopeptidase n=1 Tax=Sphingomonas sp. 28-62-20 TaxID=1970433 RepID=UPI000AF96980|nr:MAG: hypothetical protein B7Y43_10320 [Sphingomonas sp. 28-62-20]
MKNQFALALAVIALAPITAQATTQHLCPSENVAVGADGRLLGHLPYGQATVSELVPAPAAFALGLPCLLRPEAAADLGRMLAAAALTPGMAGRIRAVSCYRTIERQRAVFCSQIGPNKRCRNAAERARAVGPPGYSEHATGYAIDFGTRPSPGCRDVDACFAWTPAGKWLIAHAPDFGFELSFPAGNAQGVTWEPWHWRWVGTSASAAGAGPARAIFARARRDFAALPMIPEGTPVLAVPPLIAAPGRPGGNAVSSSARQMPSVAPMSPLIAAPGTQAPAAAPTATPRIETPPLR